MDLYGCHFEYAGVLSRKYGLIIANVSTERNALITGKVEHVSAFNKRNQARYDIGTVYSNAPLEFDMEVVSEDPISGEWRRQIQKWLFNQKGFQKLYVDRADGVLGEAFDLVDGTPMRVYLNCRFINPQVIEGNGGIVGYKFTVICDSRMAWQDPITRGFIMADSSEHSIRNILVRTDTDMDGFTYPRVLITTGSTGGEIGVCNLSDDAERITSFTDVPANTTILMNGATNYVSGNFYEHFVDRNFIRLVDGDNDISVIGDIVSIEIEWQNMRYL